MGHRQSGYARIPNDLYQTPAWVTRSLLRTYPLLPVVWEPAAGTGKMVRVLEEAGRVVYASDKTNHDGIFFIVEHDFLNESGNTPFLHSGTYAVVTNPPYGPLAEPFIRRALELTGNGRGQVAMLLPTDFDHGSERQSLFAGPPFAAKIMLPHRIKWIEGSKGGPTHNHCWFVWNWTHKGPAHALYAPRTPLEERK